MRLAIASGKGGTGKTTLSVNLAVALSGSNSIGLLDCDVEEPNCHLYLRPSDAAIEPVGTPVPVVDGDYCTGCGLCASACAFNALLALPGKPLLLPELCHSCGVCSCVCPEQAVSEADRAIGVVCTETVDGLYMRWGQLNVGEARCTPAVRAVKDLSTALALDLVVVDCPPGVACPAVESMKDADFVLLVTEPTAFGLHDLRLAVETVRHLRLPFGVVLNRAGIGDSRVGEFCEAEGIDVLLEIPFSRAMAEACSRGEILAKSDAAFAEQLRLLADAVRARAGARAGKVTA